MRPVISALPVLLATTAFAFDKPKAYLPHTPPKVAPAVADVYDMVVIDKARPYWVRFRVRADGRPFAHQWDRALDALFADVDRDGNGGLDAAECKRVPHPTILNQAMQSGYPYYAQWPAPRMDDLDRDRDGRVTRAELETYYLRMNVQLVRTSPPFSPDGYAEVITRELFDLLDPNRDGKITSAEARAAETWLDRFDLDEDELLTAAELVPGFLTGVRGQPQPPAASADLPLFFRIDAPPPGIAQRLLNTYDRDKDFHLTRSEIGLDAEAFAALDRDGNGKLDVPELADLILHGLPDLELRLAVPRDGVTATLERVVARRRPATVRADGMNQVTIKLDRLQFSYGTPQTATTQATQLRDYYRRTFAQVFMQTANGKSYVDATDVAKPSGRTLQPLLAPADRDGDGKLTMTELSDHAEMLFRFADAPLTLSLLSLSPNLFVDLDANKDGRLSRAELRSAWASLSAGHPSADALERPEGRVVLRPVVHRGQQTPFTAVTSYVNPTTTVAPTRGPLWFRKMDRNRDGSVSRREFLGTRTDFDRLDRNRDELLDPDEAELAK